MGKKKGEGHSLLSKKDGLGNADEGVHKRKPLIKSTIEQKDTERQ